MNDAFCINCGSQKKDPHTKCKSCGFKPVEKLDIIKSVWLSKKRCLSEKDLEFNQGPDEKELIEFAESLKAGDPASYPRNELDILTKQYDAVSDGSAVKVMLFGFMFLIIPIAAVITWIYKSF